MEFTDSDLQFKDFEARLVEGESRISLPIQVNLHGTATNAPYVSNVFISLTSKKNPEEGSIRFTYQSLGGMFKDIQISKHLIKQVLEQWTDNFPDDFPPPLKYFKNNFNDDEDGNMDEEDEASVFSLDYDHGRKSIKSRISIINNPQRPEDRSVRFEEGGGGEEGEGGGGDDRNNISILSGFSSPDIAATGVSIRNKPNKAPLPPASAPAVHGQTGIASGCPVSMTMFRGEMPGGAFLNDSSLCRKCMQLAADHNL